MAATGRCPRDHPRIRGEHESHRLPVQRVGGSSPHTRGALPFGDHVGVGPGIIPAYAGSTRKGGKSLTINKGSSPHTRGAPTFSAIDSPPLGIIPAYAGSTGLRRRRCRGRRDHPRIRGEHDKDQHTQSMIMGSSPHTRGARLVVAGDGVLRWIIPAYAGSTPRAGRVCACRRDHPRIRGEHGPPVVENQVAGGSSPHTRGAPALASQAHSIALDHPRIRGEHVEPSEMLTAQNGSSPHTRGARHAAHECDAIHRIIPAYAGSTMPPRSRSRRHPDHPRIRGEHVSVERAVIKSAGSSPHTRGAPTPPLPRISAMRIIPAYAGSTSISISRRRETADHPRIRGEHGMGSPYPAHRQGSSPHTRGAREHDVLFSARLGIIPAYAGSTLGNPCNTKDRRRDYTSFPLPVTHPSGGGGS